MAKTCQQCGVRMRFWNSGKGPICAACIRQEMEAVHGTTPKKEVVLAGKVLRCFHCEGTIFYSRRVLLNTRGMAFLDLDWLSRGSSAHVCSKCGVVAWSVDLPGGAES